MTRARWPLALPDPALVDRTEGMMLRPWRAADADALREAWADADVVHGSAVPPAPDLAAARRWIDGVEARRAAGLALDLVVTGLDDDAVRGEVGLTVTEPGRRWAEIGYWTAPAWRRRGVATTAVRLVAGWALRPPLSLARLYARVGGDNAGSAAVLEAAGFALRAPLDDGRSLWTA